MKILAFGSHPDDIEVGMGGTVAKYTANGHEVCMIVAAIPNKREVRKKEAEDASNILRAELRILDINASELTFNRELVRIFDELMKEHSPDIVYAPWNHDSHQDHVAISNTVITSTRDNNCSLYMYEQTIPGGIVPYSFSAQSYVDISDVIDTKIESLLAHKSQVKMNREWWLNGIKGRAMYRGYQINVNYAEAFEVIREIREIR